MYGFIQLRGSELYANLGSSPGAGSNSTTLQRLKFLSIIPVVVPSYSTLLPPVSPVSTHSYISDNTVSTKLIHLLILIQGKGAPEILMVSHLFSINSFHEV